MKAKDLIEILKTLAPDDDVVVGESFRLKNWRKPDLEPVTVTDPKLVKLNCRKFILMPI